jgi:hypothetical protein
VANAEGAKGFVALKDRLAEATGLPVDNIRLTYLTTLTLRLEQLSARVIAGEAVPISELVSLRDAIVELTPAEPTTVTVKFCETITGVCPSCGGRVENYTPPPAPEKPQPITDAEPIKAEPIKKAKSGAPPLPAPPPKRDPSTLGIHHAHLPDGTPARMPRTDESWRRHVGSSGVYDVFQPAQDWDAAHPLPTPPEPPK